jgi:hypothetical protein
MEFQMKKICLFIIILGSCLFGADKNTGWIKNYYIADNSANTPISFLVGIDDTHGSYIICRVKGGSGDQGDYVYFMKQNPAMYQTFKSLLERSIEYSTISIPWGSESVVKYFTYYIKIIGKDSASFNIGEYDIKSIEIKKAIIP